MALIFHKTKLQQKLSKSLSHAASSRSKQSKFGTPKESSRMIACMQWVGEALMKRERRRSNVEGECKEGGESRRVRECGKEKMRDKGGECKRKDKHRRGRVLQS
jgi:hypothetical protein